MNNTDPQKLKDLLYVYGYLVRYRIIPASEVIQWADAIVMQEDEPDYFFLLNYPCVDFRMTWIPI